MSTKRSIPSGIMLLWARIMCRLSGHIQRWNPDDADRYCRRCMCDLYPHETRRRVQVKEGCDAGRIGTVIAEYPPDYSSVMLDGFTRAQAFRESEICTYEDKPI